MRGSGRSLKGWAGIVVAACLLITSPAHGKEPAAKEKKAAQALLDEGNQLLGDGDYTAALEKFRAAHARYPSQRIMLNIGTTLRQLGRNVEAAGAYEQYLAAPDADPARSADARRILKELDALTGRVHVTVEGTFDAVRLDGKKLEKFASGARIRVEPGEHTLIADRAGSPAAVEAVKVAPSEERAVTLRFLAPKVKTVVVEKPVTSPRRTAGLLIGGVGAASVAAGAGFGLLARSQNAEASQHCLSSNVCDARGVALGEDALTSATVSTVAVAAGAGLLATGALLVFTAPRSERAPGRPLAAFGVSAAPTQGGAVVALGGVF